MTRGCALRVDDHDSKEVLGDIDFSLSHHLLDISHAWFWNAKATFQDTVAYKQLRVCTGEYLVILEK